MFNYEQLMESVEILRRLGIITHQEYLGITSEIEKLK